jgi:hypothetical protein
MKISTILDHIDSGHIPALASGAGFCCFTASVDFRAYVETEILHLGGLIGPAMDMPLLELEKT